MPSFEAIMRDSTIVAADLPGTTLQKKRAALYEIDRVLGDVEVIDLSGVSAVDGQLPPEDGMVRLYRGRSSNGAQRRWRPVVAGDPIEASGRWFTTSLDYAQTFKRGRTEVAVLDVPFDVARRSFVPMRSLVEGGAPQFVIPPEGVLLARPLIRTRAA